MNTPTNTPKSQEKLQDKLQYKQLTLEELKNGVLNGDRAFLGKALSLVESQKEEHGELARQLVQSLLAETGRSIRIGISGSPGVGKSTFINALGLHFIVEKKLKVAVLAVDPASSHRGGSILGDKTRMLELSQSDNAFIRPSSNRGILGGVASQTRESIYLCEAALYDVVIVETVGVGQSEKDVANMVDWFLYLDAPGSGDDLQGIKKGILEDIDYLIINKADSENAESVNLKKMHYLQAFQLLFPSLEKEHPPTMFTCSSTNGLGIKEIVDIIQERHLKCKVRGDLFEKRQQQLVSWLWAIVEKEIMKHFYGNVAIQGMRAEIERDVQYQKMEVYNGAQKLLESYKAQFHVNS